MFKKTLTIFLFCILTTVNFAQNRMTPELLWDLKRVSNIQISPDGQQILYSVKTYDLKANTGVNQLYLMPISGGTAKQITNGVLTVKK